MLSDIEMSYEICGGGKSSKYGKGGKGGNSLRISNSFNKINVAFIAPVNFTTNSNINVIGFGVIQKNWTANTQINKIIAYYSNGQGSDQTE